MERHELADITRESADAGAAVAMDLFRTALAVETKDGKTDVVTRADHEAHDAVVARIEDAVPGAAIYGEEGRTVETIPTEGVVWVIDPIDGTNNYVRGNRRWATSVVCLLDGQPVAAANVLPAMGDSYFGTPEGVTRNGDPVSVSDRSDPELFEVVPTIWWGFDRRDEYGLATSAIVSRFGDLRRPGSAQASLSLLAAGTVDGVITNVQTNPWDTIAGAAMVEWAGGTVTDLDGEDWTYESRGLVASNGRAHEEVLAATQEIDGSTTTVEKE